jgi:hypothetical protein
VTTIAYDRPVKDLIAGLDATGHVTHTAYRKTSVTFHHNGGRLSHEGVLEVWKTREASAHFDVDGVGDIAQYVRLNEYAWATGNTEGNKSSVSIELANATLAPDYIVADATWQSGARLAGWIFARAFGFAPTRETVHVHHDWKSTLCAGPFIDRIREQLFQAVLAAYNEFAGSPTPASVPTPPAGKKSLAVIAKEVIAGDWGNGPDRSRRLAEAGYNSAEVQAEVNRQLGVNVGNAPTRISISLLASQVIAGQWGNGRSASVASPRLGTTTRPFVQRSTVGCFAADIFVPREVF